jgi:5-methylthioadenosine/S-adenosylhomocysteine deaminase
MPSPPIDPLTSPKYALDGRVVTMNPDFTVLDRGVIYIDAGTIVAVEGTGDPYPPGFEDAPMIRTGSTIYPGLIELHNHLSYNVLPLWDVPQAYTNRSKWAGTQ